MTSSRKNLKNSQPIIKVFTGVEELNFFDRPLEKSAGEVSEKPVKEKKKYAEERKRMMNELRQKPKPKNKDFVVQWVGVENIEEKRLYEVLKEAITEEEDIYLTEVPISQIPEIEDEEVIDRDDVIANKEIIVIEETPVPIVVTNSDENMVARIIH